MIAGTPNNDFLTGTPTDDSITALSGDDVVFGLEGNDDANGDDGNDNLNGNKGNDTVRGGQGDDIVRGGQDNDSVTGDVGSDALYGDLGDDLLSGGSSDSATPDLLGNDMLFGGDGNDMLFGNQGEDVLFGDEGDDRIFGGQGNDRIFGGAGNDRLEGNLGADTFSGGAGTDIFVIGGSAAGSLEIDNILDFRKGEDFIELSGGLTFENLNLLAGTGENTGNTIVQNQLTGATLSILQGVSPTELTQSDFRLPSQSLTPTLASGEAVSYADASQGVIARLDRNLVFFTEFGTFPRIMPLGDSITRGFDGESPPDLEGGYRPALWNQLQDFGFIANFVGSQFSGPESSPDRDHEGHPGRSIGFIRGNVIKGDGTGWLQVNPADLVLLIAGTNSITNAEDSSDERADNLIDLLGQTIDRITESDVFNGEVLVGSIPPFNPDLRTSIEIELVQKYNARIPNLVNQKVAEGKKITFVDINSTIRVPDDLANPDNDSGIHPSPLGYAKIANAWFNSLLGTTGVAAPLNNVDQVTGSAFNDALVGNANNNMLDGGTGTDRLTGGQGSDLLTGGLGVDGFIYNSPADGGDLITDFSLEEGDILMISTSGFGGGLLPGSVLTSFVASPTPTAIGLSGTFLYNTSTGELSFDADGEGAGTAVTIATLAGAPSLSADRFALLV